MPKVNEDAVYDQIFSKVGPHYWDDPFEDHEPTPWDMICTEIETYCTMCPMCRDTGTITERDVSGRWITDTCPQCWEEGRFR